MIPRRKIHTINHEFFTALRFLRRKTASQGLIEEFKSMFASYIGVREAIPVGSGRQGLEYILLGLELSCGDEVILPAYTLLDLAVRIRAMGLRPVFADIEPLTFTMDPDALKRKISPRTRVILATHMFGAPSQIARIMDIASQRGIFVVEDCAHAVGASLNGRMLGSFGTAGFSVSKP